MRVGLRRAPKTSDRLYIIRMSGTNYVKIGVTNDVRRRRSELQTGNPYRLDVEYTKFVGDGAGELESGIHKLCHSRHVRREWYWLKPEEVRRLIEYVGL